MKRFNWSNFGAEFLQKVLESPETSAKKRPSHQINDPDSLAAFVDALATAPDQDFIRKYRHVIENVLFKNDPHALVRTHNRLTGEKKSMNLPAPELDEVFAGLTRKHLSQRMVSAYANTLLQIGRVQNDVDFISPYSSPLTVNLAKTEFQERRMFPYQEKAVADLEKHFQARGNQTALLVMPTGSGKTFTAISYLLEKMVAGGYQVVWLTHRHMLVDQPADDFFQFSAYAKKGNPKMSKLHITCVSGEHASIRRAEKAHNILILTVQSTINNLEYLKLVLNDKVVIVVDEAHHSVAKSYVKTIDFIKLNTKECKLLGLTATPIRISDESTRHLMDMYDSTVICPTSMSELIREQVLADPIFDTVSTGFKIEADFDEQKYIKKYGEISEKLKDKVARSSARNKVIVDQYMRNREKYGKTLIFALNVYHCITLCEDFKTQGVKCDFVYHNKKDNANVMKRFRDGDLDVLININILSEGSDIPEIQTIFLTRPTTSEALLMQMIGRGMRGKAAGGTESVSIVDFNDIWNIFAAWLNPRFLLEREKSPPPSTKPAARKELYYIPFEVKNNQTIVVSFGDSMRQFLYPDAFANFLIADNAAVQKKAMEEYRIRIKEESKPLPPPLPARESIVKKPAINPSPPACMAQAPKPRKHKNIIFKCNYCDGGASKTNIGFNGVCSQRNIHNNVIKRKYTYCSSERSACAGYISGVYTYDDLRKMMESESMLCYESVALRDWQMDMGWDLTTPEGTPRKLPDYVQRNSLCILTTREPEAPENKRMVFAVFLVKEFYEGNTVNEAGCVIAHDDYRIALTLDEARKTLLWNYYNNQNNPTKPRWGSGLTRSMDDENAVALLSDIVAVKRGMNDEPQAKMILDRYCELNQYDPDNPPDKLGALNM